MIRLGKASLIIAAISYSICGSAQAAIVNFNTFTSPPVSMTAGDTVGFTFAGNKFVGSIYVNGTGSLYSTDLTGGNAQPFAPSVSLTGTSSAEHFVAASFGLGGFPNGDIYAADGSSITHITNNGASSNTFVSGLGGEVRGITFDQIGTFAHDMLVTTNAGNVYKVNSSGSATLLANVGEDVEGLDVAPLGNNFSTFDGDLIVASEGSGMLRAISPSGGVTPLSNGSGSPVIIPSAEELTFVPLNLGLSGGSLEGLYGSNYGADNVQKANENQFLGMQGDIIVTGELNGNVSQVQWTGSQFVVTSVGSFGSYPPNQPEDGIFVTPTILQAPEPGTLSLIVAGLAIATIGTYWRRRKAAA
jgi:hypothetical protein